MARMVSMRVDLPAELDDWTRIAKGLASLRETMAR